jgi:hypothetical protein
MQLKMEASSSAQKNNSIILPPHIERKSYQLTVDIYRAVDVKPVDGTTVDPYVGVEFGMIYSKTRPIANECNPIWNESVEVPVHTPSKIANIVLRLIDSNLIQKPEVLGSCYLKLSKLLEEANNLLLDFKERNSNSRFDKRRWLNFYGAQLNCKDNDAKQKYSIYPDHAPYFVGTVLCRSFMELKSNPVRDHHAIKEDPNNKFVPRPYVHYLVTIQFDMGMNLPQDSKKYAL